MTESAIAGEAAVGTVQLTVPADPAYVSVLRTVTASLAARRDFTFDEIEDLRIAVDEACALLLPHARSAASLSAVFAGTEVLLRVVVSVELGPAEIAGAEPGATGSIQRGQIDETSFAWMVLAALADTVSTELTEQRLSLTLTKARGTRT